MHYCDAAVHRYDTLATHPVSLVRLRSPFLPPRLSSVSVPGRTAGTKPFSMAPSSGPKASLSLSFENI